MSGSHAGEFASLREVAAELGFDPERLPQVERRDAEIGDGQRMSAVVWGTSPPELVLIHGGGQNARTWDLVAMKLGRPVVAVDLPGHGHSSWRTDRDYGPAMSAGAVVTVVEQLATNAACVVGMSLGGLTMIRLAATRPDLVRRAVIVDITPGSAAARKEMSAAERGATVLLDGPPVFASLDEMVELAVKASPRRSAFASRRGVIHNSFQRPDGQWAWRHDMHRAIVAQEERDLLWRDLAKLQMPVMLVRGADSRFVTDSDLAEFTRRLPAARIETVPDAGHAVQSDQPHRLAELIDDFLPSEPVARR